MKYIIVFLAGTLVGFLSTRWSFFSFAEDLNIVDIVGIVVNIFLAYFISKVLEKRKTEQRIEKDILIDKLKKIESIPNKIIIVDNKTSFNVANSVFKDINSEIESLVQLMKYVEITLDHDKIEGLRAQNLALKRIITDQKVEEGNLIIGTFPAGRATIVSREFSKLIFQLIIDCNRL